MVTTLVNGLKNGEMHIKLSREIFNDKCTLGRMYVDGHFFAHTLEDKYRGQLDNPADKVYGETAIPYGVYKVTVTESKRFGKKLPILHNVPRFDGIRIHGGNTAADSLGCILAGAETNGINTVSNCKERVETLTKMIELAGEAMINVTNNNSI